MRTRTCVMKMKKYLFPLLLLCAFLLGGVGHILLRPAPVAEQDYTLVFRAEKLTANLRFSLPKEGARLFIDERPATIKETVTLPAPLYSRENGSEESRPSLLYDTIFFTLSVKAHQKEGRLYLGDRMLLVGDTVALSGENLRIYAVLWDFRTVF